MTEQPPSRRNPVCKRTVPKPDPKLVVSAREHPHSFVGRLVKKAFPATRRNGMKAWERLWVAVLSVNESGELVARIDTEPLIAQGNLRQGTMVVVKPEEIEEVRDPYVRVRISRARQAEGGEG